MTKRERIAWDFFKRCLTQRGIARKYRRTVYQVHCMIIDINCNMRRTGYP